MLWQSARVTASVSPRKISPAPALRVLQVLPRLGDGGVEQSAVEMSGFLTSEGIFNAVASAGGRKVAGLQVPHVTMPLHSKNPLIILMNAWRLRRVIRRLGITVVHARSRAPAWSAWLAAWGLPAVFLTTFHGTYGSGNTLKRLYNRVMLKGPVTIANSVFIKDHIRRVYGYPAARIFVAPRGIEPERFDPAALAPQVAALRKELRLAKGVPVIVMVGRITRWKGQHVLVAALAEISDLDWVCLLIGGPEGNGSYAQEVTAQIADAGLGDRIRLLGSRQDVPALLGLATVAVSASTRAEAFGRTAIEAQAMGVPVVATALGGSLETVKDGETGYLVEPNTPHPMADRLRHLLTQPRLAATLGAKARAWVLGTYTVTQCCRAEHEAYLAAANLVSQKQRVK